LGVPLNTTRQGRKWVTPAIYLVIEGAKESGALGGGREERAGREVILFSKSQ